MANVGDGTGMHRPEKQQGQSSNEGKQANSPGGPNLGQGGAGAGSQLESGGNRSSGMSPGARSSKK